MFTGEIVTRLGLRVFFRPIDYCPFPKPDQANIESYVTRFDFVQILTLLSSDLEVTTCPPNLKVKPEFMKQFRARN